MKFTWEESDIKRAIGLGIKKPDTEGPRDNIIVYITGSPNYAVCDLALGRVYLQQSAEDLAQSLNKGEWFPVKWPI